MSGLMAFNYQMPLDKLAAQSWLVDMFRRHLNADCWLPSDKARGQPIGTGSGKKRAREQDKLEAPVLGMKSQRHSNGRGVRSGS
jgi:hypothetical protein